MAKTIVNIITEANPIPAYLFIKEMYEAEDRLMYISAKDTEDDLDALSELFNVPATMIDEIVLKHDMDEFSYEKICRTVIRNLNREINYCVNLAGGTRYMALAVQQVFEKYNAQFYYVQVEENLIVHSIFHDSIYDNDDVFYPIKYRMTIAEYLLVHNIQHNLLGNMKCMPIRSENDAKRFFDLFSKQRLSEMDYVTMELLRKYYRNRNYINIRNLDNPTNEHTVAVPGLSELLFHVGFVPRKEGVLRKCEIEYLTGGWFEEYVYYLVKKFLNPQDIAIGVEISRKGMKHKNELDVVFMKGNKLFVIECKTGVQTERLFNQIVYKACAISEALLGISSNPYIFSLKKDDKNELKRISENMGITFVDNSILMSPTKLKLSLSLMDIEAKER